MTDRYLYTVTCREWDMEETYECVRPMDAEGSTFFTLTPSGGHEVYIKYDAVVKIEAWTTY